MYWQGNYRHDLERRLFPYCQVASFSFSYHEVENFTLIRIFIVQKLWRIRGIPEICCFVLLTFWHFIPFYCYTFLIYQHLTFFGNIFVFFLISKRNPYLTLQELVPNFSCEYSRVNCQTKGFDYYCTKQLRHGFQSRSIPLYKI